jgi:hypothetical protein
MGTSYLPDLQPQSFASVPHLYLYTYKSIPYMVCRHACDPPHIKLHMPSTKHSSVITTRPTATENFSPINNLVILHSTKLLPYEKLHFLYLLSHFCIYHTQLLFIIWFTLKLGTARPDSRMRITDLQRSFHVFHLR